MRLWDYRLVIFLPDLQLKAQWREINSILKKQDKHILINYVYEYEKHDLLIYTLKVILEMKNRGFKIKSLKNCYDYFGEKMVNDWLDDGHPGLIGRIQVFEHHHTDDYLLTCFFNLREKYIRGQKGFDSETYFTLKRVVCNYIDPKKVLGGILYPTVA